MDLKTRAALVRALRVEIKQRRTGAPAAERTPEEERQRNATRWLRTIDRRRPRLRAGDNVGAHRRAVASYESDIGRRGGYAVGERLREMREARGPNTNRSRPFGVDGDSAAHAALTRRANVTLVGRTQMTGMNPGNRGVNRVLTPSQRINEVGTRSRRRRVSPGMAPMANRNGVVPPPLPRSRR